MANFAATSKSSYAIFVVGFVVGVGVTSLARFSMSVACDVRVAAPAAVPCPPCAATAALAGTSVVGTAPVVSPVIAPAGDPPAPTTTEHTAATLSTALAPRPAAAATAAADWVDGLDAPPATAVPVARFDDDRPSTDAATASPSPAPPATKFVPPRRSVSGSRLEKSLAAMVAKYGQTFLTDKFTIHDYAPMYEKVLAPYMVHMDQPFKYLEIGLGCIPFYFNAAGLGYRFIKYYAPHVDYYGLDLMPCNFSHLGPEDAAYLHDGRVTRGSQVDPAALDAATRKAGGWFDVIVDDGSHVSQHIIRTFLHLFQYALRPGGVYCIEDLSASWIAMGGHPRSAQVSRTTSVNFIQNLIAQLQFPFHWRDKPLPRSFEPYVHPRATFPITKLGAMIRSIDCDREICCITKMDNAPEAKHKFSVPCDKDVCEIPPLFVKE